MSALREKAADIVDWLREYRLPATGHPDDVVPFVISDDSVVSRRVAGSMSGPGPSAGRRRPSLVAAVKAVEHQYKDGSLLVVTTMRHTSDEAVGRWLVDSTVRRGLRASSRPADLRDAGAFESLIALQTRELLSKGWTDITIRVSELDCAFKRLAIDAQTFVAYGYPSRGTVTVVAHGRWPASLVLVPEQGGL